MSDSFSFTSTTGLYVSPFDDDQLTALWRIYHSHTIDAEDVKIHWKPLKWANLLESLEWYGIFSLTQAFVSQRVDCEAAHTPKHSVCFLTSTYTKGQTFRKAGRGGSRILREPRMARHHSKMYWEMRWLSGPRSGKDEPRAFKVNLCSYSVEFVQRSFHYTEAILCLKTFNPWENNECLSTQQDAFLFPLNCSTFLFLFPPFHSKASFFSPPEKLKFVHFEHFQGGSIANRSA